MATCIHLWSYINRMNVKQCELKQSRERTRRTWALASDPRLIGATMATLQGVGPDND